MHLLLASLSTALAAPVLVIDDNDADVADFREIMETTHGHELTMSSDFGVFEWTFEGDLTAADGSVVELSQFDVIVWFDGGSAAGASMPELGQEALLEFVSSGGGVLSFGQNGYNYLTGRHGYLAPLIPLRSWTYYADGSIVCDSEDFPICEDYEPDEPIAFTGGHLATAYLASTDAGTRFASYKPWWDSTYWGIGAAHFEHGLGRGIQWGLWGNSGASIYQSPWWDATIGNLMNESINWLAQGGPPVADAGGPYTGFAGDLFVLSGEDSRARGDAELVEYRWDIGSEYSIDTSDEIVEFDSRLIDGPATLIVNLQVEDDAGRTSNASTTLFADNADPVVDEMDCPESLDEGEAGVFETTVYDPEILDTWSIRWQIDGTTAAEGETVSMVFSDNGEAVVTVRVEDDDGGTAVESCPEPIRIENVAPTIIGTPPTLIDALSTYRFRPEVSDPGTFDVHTWALEGPAGSAVDPISGTVEWTPTIDDVGSHELTLQVNDGDDDAFFSWTIDVRWPDLDGDGYRYDDDCDDDDATVYPGAAELCDGIDSDCDGSLADDFSDLDDDASPDCIDPDADGDGFEEPEDCNDRDEAVYPGADEACDFTDSDCDGSLVDEFDDSDADGEPDCIDGDLDGDGMADAWEEAFGLDPDDPTDGDSDSDGDGRTALEEFETGSDPEIYEGPGAPSVFSPVEGAEINDVPVVVTVIDGDAPLGQELTHSFTISDSELLDVPFERIEDVSGSDDGTTSATIATPLEENSWVYWTANAHDAFTSGSSMPVARFFVNLINEPPGIPGLDAPLDGSSTDAFELVAAVPSDPDLDEVYVMFTLVLMDGTVLISDERMGTDGTVSWTPPIAPIEGEEMCWSATAVDEHGLEGAVSETACFTLDLTNLAPSAPVIEAPGSNGIAPSLTPTIRVINGEDPEGRSTEHRFELDLDSTFSSDALQQATLETDPTGTTSWTADVPFEEDSLVYVRVLCTDGSNNSEWTTSQFLVSETNNPPSTPVLLDPQDGVAFGEDMLLVITNSTDPEGSEVRHDFKVLDLRDGLIAETSDIEQGEETTEWSPGVLSDGHYQWTARAIDAEGEESEWAVTRSFVVGTPDQVEEPELGGMVSDGKSNGCSCSNSGQSPGHLVWTFGLIGLIAQRRNRPRC